MATLYYNDGTGDHNWSALGNWWTDADFNIQATALPTATDNVVLSSSASGSDGTAITVANLELNDPSENGVYLELNITVTGTAIFNSIVSNNGTITGNAVFNAAAYNYGLITGNATFNGTSGNSATVTGDATFNGFAINGGEVGGNATFNNSSRHNIGNIVGNATFNDTAVLAGGYVTGAATLYDYASVDGSNYPSVETSVTLNDYATANGSWNNYGLNPTTFNDHASLTDLYVTIEPCVFNDHATCSGQGMTGGATFNDLSVCSAVGVFGGGTFTFNDSSTGGFSVYTAGWVTVEPQVTYNDKSYGSGQAIQLIINGAAVMQNANLNGYNPVLDYSFTRPQYGINGSSILGVI